MLSLTHILKEALVYTSIFFGFASFPDEGGKGAQRTFKLESEGLLSADGYLLGLGKRMFYFYYQHDIEDIVI